MTTNGRLTIHLHANLVFAIGRLNGNGDGVRTFGTESGVPDWPGTIENHPWPGQTIVDWSIYDIFVDISTELGKSDPVEERNRGFAPHKFVVLFGKIEALDRDIDG